MDTAVASSTTSAGVAVTVTPAPSSSASANGGGGGATLLSPASSSTQLNSAGDPSAAAASSVDPLRQALQDAVRCGWLRERAFRVGAVTSEPQSRFYRLLPLRLTLDLKQLFEWGKCTSPLKSMTKMFQNLIREIT